MMATYIVLMTLTPDGQARALADPDFLLAVARDIAVPGVTTMGCYAVLGAYDFVTMLEADDNEQVARFSLELGVRAGVHTVTLPAVPVGLLEERNDDDLPAEFSDVRLTPEIRLD